MKILFIGGTGIISSACAELAVARGHDLFLVNRALSRKVPIPEGATVLQADVYADEARLVTLLADHHFDVVVFELSHVCRSYGYRRVPPSRGTCGHSADRNRNCDQHSLANVCLRRKANPADDDRCAAIRRAHLTIYARCFSLSRTVRSISVDRL